MEKFSFSGSVLRYDKPIISKFSAVTFANSEESARNHILDRVKNQLRVSRKSRGFELSGDLKKI